MKLSNLVRAATERSAFNKYNAVELMSQLMGVLQQNGLEDAVAALKKVTPIINKAWSQRSGSVRQGAKPFRLGQIAEIYAQAAKHIDDQAGWLEEISKQSPEAASFSRQLSAMVPKLKKLADKFQKLDEQE